MLVGFFGKTLVLGLVLCSVFGISAYVGGWIAYGVGLACAVVVTAIVAIVTARFEVRLGKALDDFARDGDLEGVLAEAGTDGLGGAISSVVKVMAEGQQHADLYENALKGLGNPAFLCDSNGRILLATKSLLELLNKPLTQVCGFTVSQAFYNREGV